MSKIIDVSQLGEREIVYREMGTITNEVGMTVMSLVTKKRMEAQPLLTKEESMVLVEEDWDEYMPNGSSDGVPKAQKYVCIAGGRRFFAEEIPVKETKPQEITREITGYDPEPKTATVTAKVVPEPTELPVNGDTIYNRTTGETTVLTKDMEVSKVVPQPAEVSALNRVKKKESMGMPLTNYEKKVKAKFATG